MSEHTTSVETLEADPEARLDFLVDAGVLDVTEADQVTTTAAFEDTRSIYADTYEEVDDADIVETVVDLFDVSEATARAQFEAGDVTRHDVVTYLSLQSFLDRDLPREALALLATMAAEVGFGSPVPSYMTTLTDDTYREFLEEAGDALVFVWKYPCDPCRRMKGELPDLLDHLPEAVAVAGVDGESVSDFRAAFEVDTAPTVLLFADGDLAERREGYTSPADLAAAIDAVYDAVTVEFVDEA
jgi:thiol-disulfide isomerase/thioredoxin